MIKIRKILKFLLSNNPITIIYKLIFIIGDYLFDFKYGVETGSIVRLEGLMINSSNMSRSSFYQPTRILPLKKLFIKLKKTLPKNSVLVDLGCGKGRALLVAAEAGFKIVRGVEFAHELCEVARKNCAKFCAKTGAETDFKVVYSDAVHYDFRRDENVIFMYHPFDEVVMSAIVRKLMSSLKIYPRSIWIIYHNPVHSKVIEKKIEKITEFRYYGYNFIVYSNQNHNDISRDWV